MLWSWIPSQNILKKYFYSWITYEGMYSVHTYQHTIHTWKHKYINIYTHIFIHTNTHTYLWEPLLQSQHYFCQKLRDEPSNQLCIHTHTYTYVQCAVIYMEKYMHTCMYRSSYLCMYVCMYMYVCVSVICIAFALVTKYCFFHGEKCMLENTYIKNTRCVHACSLHACSLHIRRKLHSYEYLFSLLSSLDKPGWKGRRVDFWL